MSATLTRLRCENPVVFAVEVERHLDQREKVGKNTAILGAVMRKQSLYFKISQVSKILGVSPSSLRTWELVGLIRPARSQGRYRLYSSDDLETAKRILHLRKVKGLNLAGVSHLLSTKKPSEGKRARLRTNTTAGVSDHLLKLRRKQGYTLAQVARQAGVSISFLSAMDAGEPSLPSPPCSG